MSKVNKLFKSELEVINIGLESFFNELKEQEVKVVHVDWKPSAGGNKKMASMLSRLKSKK